MWVVVVVVGLFVIAFIAWLIFRPPADAYGLCAKLIPGDNKIGLVIKVPEKGPPHIDFGAGTNVDPKVVEAIDKITACVRDANPAKLVPLQGRLTTTEREPLGQLADRWRREDGIKVRLAIPTDKSETAKTLNNLSIGPSNGEVTKVALIADWCRANSACVTCEPRELVPTAGEVVVRLTDSASVNEDVYQAVAGAPKADGTYEPWELVDDTRRRLIYTCKPRS